jgi:uncharacterized protein (TIGR02301 family)
VIGRAFIAPTLAAAMVVSVIGAAAAQVTRPDLQPQLERLAELLGALSYLRPLCGIADDASTRAVAAAIAAESTSEVLRARIVSSFNRGFEGFATIHRKCTPNAAFVVELYQSEAAALAGELADGGALIR